MSKKWMFTVDVDGVYYPDVYEGHSHPYPDSDLIACAKFNSTNGSIEDIIENLGEWEFFTDDKELQKEIKSEPMAIFTDEAFYKNHEFPDELHYPVNPRHPYGMARYVYGAIHIWKKDGVKQ